ncbi:unnamed protein product [Diabrotica balteata]|uniref:Uncharacterized protein n=1 Tax=Diabrotica balteata TaxID=107213 RepID=A0A9N9T417_DIABA|nr:unnamed protein product [Diabrotica balteata]
MYLNKINIFLEILKHEEKASLAEYIGDIVYVVTLGIWVLTWARGGDNIDQTGINIIDRYRVLQTKINDPVMKEQVVYFIRFLQKLRPELTACGFTTINRKLITSFFITLTPYIVIVLQIHTNID